MPKMKVPTVKGAAFSEVIASGQKVQGSLLTLFWRAAPQRALGITVSRKVRTAVQRNRAKRRVREVVRLNADKIPQGVEIVCIAHPEVVGAPFERLVEEFLHQLRAVRGSGTR